MLVQALSARWGWAIPPLPTGSGMGADRLTDGESVDLVFGVRDGAVPRDLERGDDVADGARV